MRRHLISILLLINYFNAGLAVGIDIHFCGGQVADVQLIGLGHAHCDCPAGGLPEGCCKNEYHFCTTDNHKAPPVTAFIQPETFIDAPVLLPDYINPLQVINFEKNDCTVFNRCRFKYKHSYPLFILNDVLRI